MDAGIGGNGDEARIILLASLSRDLYPEVITDTFSTKPVSYTHLTLPTKA